MTDFAALTHLGWSPFFQQQLTLDEWESVTPARVIEQHKSKLAVQTATELVVMPVTGSTPDLTVGDWVLLESDGRLLRVMERHSCFKRKAAGHKVAEQLLAANVDTAFILSSLNDDFNLSRIERYLSVVYEAGAEPVVVLSKADLCADADDLLQQVQSLDSQLSVLAINCKEAASAERLTPFLSRGKTMVLLGSSGAGKSTLTNALLGEQRQQTGEIREDGDKGRHTTTHRSLLVSPDGFLIIDTPGMRELQLSDCESGVHATFADVVDLVDQCRFNDCQHQSEPGCAVRKALESGELDERRYINYAKLLKEQAVNSASIAERRSASKSQSKMYKQTQAAGRRFKGDY